VARNGIGGPIVEREHNCELSVRKDVEVVGSKNERLNHGSRSGGNSAYVVVPFIRAMSTQSQSWWWTKSIQWSKIIGTRKGKSAVVISRDYPTYISDRECFALLCPVRSTPRRSWVLEVSLSSPDGRRQQQEGGQREPKVILSTPSAAACAKTVSGDKMKW
jgi:hypothetical protein